MEERSKQYMLDQRVLDFVRQIENDDDETVNRFRDLCHNNNIKLSKQMFQIPHICCKENYYNLLQQFCRRFPREVDCLNLEGETPLFTAIKYENYYLAQFLISEGANTTHTLNNGNTILHELCPKSPSDDKMNLIVVIYSKSQDPQKLFGMKNNDGIIPLFLALKISDLPLINFFITNNMIDYVTKTKFDKGIYDYVLESRNDVIIHAFMPAIDRTMIEEGTHSIKSSEENYDYSDNLLELCESINAYIPMRDNLKDRTMRNLKGLLELPNKYTIASKIPQTLKFRKYRVLSLDGGGVKAVFQVVILKRLLKLYPNLLDNCDLFCGCSASSFLVCCLAIGYKTEPLYMNKILNIIHEMSKETFKHGFSTFIKGIVGPKYNTKNLKEVAKCLFGNMTFEDLPKSVAINTVYLGEENKEECKVCVYTNLNNENITKRLDEACLDSAAAPTYFEGRDGYFDGGVVDNNPFGTVSSMLLGKESHGGLGYSPDNVVCMSISSGRFRNMKIMNQKMLQRGGPVRWLPAVTTMFMLTRRYQTNEDCKRIYGDNYFRYDPYIDMDVELDDASKIKNIIREAEKVDLGPIRDWVESKWL